MGTTRIKVIDLSSDEKEIKTSRKHAEKLTGAAKLKKPARNASHSDAGGENKPKGKKGQEDKEGLGGKEEIITQASTEKTSAPLQPSKPSQPSEPSVPSEPSTPSAPSQPPQPSASSKPSVKSAVARPPTTAVVDSVGQAKPQSRRHKGRKYLAAKQKIEKDKQYPVKEAIVLLSQTSTTKFDPTVEIHLNVVDKNVKGTVSLPHPFAVKTKEKRYLVFSEKKQAVDGLPAGKAGKKIIWGDEKTISDIEGGQLKPGRDFDAVISTPKFMPALAKIAKILGPVGLMPNPKNKTMTENISQALISKDEGFSLKCEQQAPIIHTKVGKLSEKAEALEENLKALIFAIGPGKIKRATLTSTMGPGIRLDISSVPAK